MIDTLIVEENGVYKIEKYKGQNLDEYNYIAEMNHSKLLTYKELDYFFMKPICLKEIMEYLRKEFNQ